MIEDLSHQIVTSSVLFGLRLVSVLGYVVVAALLVRLSGRIATWFTRLAHIMPGRATTTTQRAQTLRQLYSSLISVMAFVLAFLGIMRIFVDSTQLVWIIGLFSAAFGWGARGMVSDVISGTSYIFRNTFSIGEKVEFVVGANTIEGVVEKVDMRNTLVRAPTGDLLSIPNGEIGIIRNFTRASFSGAQVHVRVPSHQLAPALETLQAMGTESMQLFPDLIEPWQVLLTESELGAHSQLMVNAKFRFGKAAAARPLLADTIHQGLAAAGIELQAA